MKIYKQYTPSEGSSGGSCTDADDSFTLYRTSPRIVELILNPDTVDTMIDFFDLETELQQGTKQLMSNGQVKITVPVSDPKARLYFEYMLETFSESGKTSLS